MCVPPKDGGKPCQGEEIKRRPCNTQPCPDINYVMNQKNTTEIRKPIVKIGRFSDRFQRYSKCQIKENDAYLATYDPVIKGDNRYPIRVIMNNSTISVFKDGTYKDNYYTYELKDTSVISDPKSDCCLYLKDTYKKTKLCGYPENCKEKSWVQGWIKDLNLFKYVCRVGRQKNIINTKRFKGNRG